ncbi:hypothetical protein JAAARDRAFT_200680 [Jaapia argillacea MUCL 33604]|uniref:Uncharacterized protein n=1 Tax=Jaapia argillacea MUCL 33604 TaxID=933084 RepID=A0A067P3Y1_9AGAM|nr:hypothetical protein JAAARDRAFT_200680 [Jaapia argillacea MUCL 33604]
MDDNVLTSSAAPTPSVPREVVPAQVPPPAQPIAVASSEIAPNSHPTFAKRTVVQSEPIVTPSVPLEVVPAQPAPKSQPTFAKRTVVKQVANPPLPLASSGVNPAQPFAVPQIDVPKSERIVVKLPVIAPPPPPRTHQDVDPPARMDVNNTGDNVSSEEIPTRTAPITFARRKVANLPRIRTPAPNNVVLGTTVDAMEAILPTHRPPTPSNDTPSLADLQPPTPTPAPLPPQTQCQHMIIIDLAEAVGAPSTSSRSPLEFTPIEHHKLLPPSISPINRPQKDLSLVLPQPVVLDWLGTASPRAIAMYYDQAHPSPTSVQNPTFCQIDASGSSPSAQVDLDEMMSRFTTLHRLPDSHIPKSIQTIPDLSIPASEDEGTPARQSEGITAAPIDKITQTPQMDDRPSDPSVDASNIAGPSIQAGNVPNQESVWQLPPRPGWKFPGDYPSRSRLHLHDAHKRVILEATQDMHLLSQIARSLEEHTSKINNLRELIWELEDGL